MRRNCESEVNINDLYEEVDEHNAYKYDCSLKVNITDVCFYGDCTGQMMRVLYWCVPGELRTYDVLYDKYVIDVRDKKLRKLGI